MADKTFVEENQAARQELAELIARLDERSFQCAAGSGWTVSTLLCHLAFWDRMALAMLTKWGSGGGEPPRLSAQSIDSINEAVKAISGAVPGPAAARLALDSAAAVDRQVEGIGDELRGRIVSAGFERSLMRSLHRREHLRRIREALS
jgi:hypothetical protein